MNKQISFLIWLYDRQLELQAQGNSFKEVDFIREEYMKFFGINDQIEKLDQKDE